MVFRDCNSNILNDFKIFLILRRPNCILWRKYVSWHAAKIENQGHCICKKCLLFHILKKSDLNILYLYNSVRGKCES